MVDGATAQQIEPEKEEKVEETKEDDLDSLITEIQQHRTTGGSSETRVEEEVEEKDQKVEVQGKKGLYEKMFGQ